MKSEAEFFRGLRDPGRTEPSAHQQSTGRWVEVTGGATRYFEITTKHCTVTLQPRPSHCDRGRWVASVHVTDIAALCVDAADFFPRYYFDFTRAKLELEEWLIARGELSP